VVTLVLYTYFIAALLGRQMLPNVLDRNGREDPDLYFPLFTVLQVNQLSPLLMKSLFSRLI